MKPKKSIFMLCFKEQNFIPTPGWCESKYFTNSLLPNAYYKNFFSLVFKKIKNLHQHLANPMVKPPRHCRRTCFDLMKFNEGGVFRVQHMIGANWEFSSSQCTHELGGNVLYEYFSKYAFHQHLIGCMFGTCVKPSLSQVGEEKIFRLCAFQK